VLVLDFVMLNGFVLLVFLIVVLELFDCDDVLLKGFYLWVVDGCLWLCGYYVIDEYLWLLGDCLVFCVG